jgi:hypothetical protein
MTGVDSFSIDLPQERDETLDRFVARRQSVGRRAVGAFDDENFGVRQFGPFARGRFAQLKVARIEQRLLAVFGQQHGRAEAMAGRIGRQTQAAPLERLPIRQMQRPSLAEPQLIERRRLGCAKGIFMPPDMVAVRVRDERPRLASAKIDRQPRLGQFQAVFPVKKGFGFQSRVFHINSEPRGSSPRLITERVCTSKPR